MSHTFSLPNRLLSPFVKARVFIDDYNGIASHLETLTMAFAIQQAYGHEIVLDWKEFDALRVSGTTRGQVRIMARLGALRLRECDAETFARLRGKKIICRCEDGPDELLNPIYLEVARRVQIQRSLAERITANFSQFGDRPIVGLHIRRGDFSHNAEAVYDPTRAEYPAVPLWWYEKLMAEIVRTNPAVKFFLASNGDPSVDAALRVKFDVFTLDISSPYHWKGAGHQSAVHPVADLFALACCPLILATPVSGYAHWAVNVLGEPSLALIPLRGATVNEPRSGIVSMPGQRLSAWRRACRGQTGNWVKDFDLGRRLPCLPARTEWLAARSAAW